MARRSRQETPNRSPIAVIITVVLLAGAALLGQITGIDLVGILTGQPSTVATAVPEVVAPGNVERLTVSKGFGAGKGFWRVYFNDPANIGSDRSTYSNGIDVPLAEAIGQIQSTLDIAAFEWNNPLLTQAVLAAKTRGVTIRIVADNEHSIEDLDTTIDQLVDAGIPIVYDQRSALMHNKFMIMDSSIVWTGSMNYTINGVYRNNNNLVMMRSRRAADAYQAEFNEMFEQKQFGSKRSTDDSVSFSQDGTPVQVLFAPDGQVVPTIISLLQNAKTSIKFMAFSFTLEDVGATLLSRAQAGVKVEGIFELIGSDTSSSRQGTLKCAGIDVRIDGNPYRLHHKVFIIDDSTVIFGSFNFSASARDSNDENLVVITDPDFAAQYVAEYNRLRSRATTSKTTCN